MAINFTSALAFSIFSDIPLQCLPLDCELFFRSLFFAFVFSSYLLFIFSDDRQPGL